MLPFARIDTIKLDTQITALKFSSALGVGFNTLLVTFASMGEARRRPWLAEPYNLPPLAHLELWSGNQIVYEGRRAQPAFKGADFATMTAFGYGNVGLKDTVFTSQAAGPTTAEAIFRQCLNAGPVTFGWANGQDIQPPSYATDLSTLSGNTPAQVIEQLSKAGDGAQLAWDFTCWDGRQVQFLPRQCRRDTSGNYTPDYYVDFDDRVELTLDEENLYGAVYVTYTDATSGVQAPPLLVGPEPTFADRYGLLRTGQINAGTTTAATATAVGWVWLYQHAWPLVRAAVKLAAGQGLPQWPLGAAQLPQLVRAGEWVQLGNDAGALPPQIIVRSEMDAFTDTVTIELGASPLSTPALVSELLSVAAHTRAGRSVTSGAAA